MSSAPHKYHDNGQSPERLEEDHSVNPKVSPAALRTGSGAVVGLDEAALCGVAQSGSQQSVLEALKHLAALESAVDEWKESTKRDLQQAYSNFAAKIAAVEEQQGTTAAQVRPGSAAAAAVGNGLNKNAPSFTPGAYGQQSPNKAKDGAKPQRLEWAALADGAREDAQKKSTSPDVGPVGLSYEDFIDNIVGDDDDEGDQNTPRAVVQPHTQSNYLSAALSNSPSLMRGGTPGAGTPIKQTHHHGSVPTSRPESANPFGGAFSSSMGRSAAPSAVSTPYKPHNDGGEVACHVLVEFKRKRVLQFESRRYVAAGEYVVVGGDRGEDIGLVTHTWEVGSQEPTGKWNDNVGVGKVLRPASNLEISQLQCVQSELESRAVEVAQERVREHKLPMTIVDAEYQFDRKKLTFFFRANQRLDFRNLVRDLYKSFRARIWMEPD